MPDPLNAVRHMAYVDGLGRIVGSNGATAAVFEQRVVTDTEVVDGLAPVHADYSKTANITAVEIASSTLLLGESTVTVNSGTWVPSVGDAFANSGVIHTVTAVASSVSCTVRPSLSVTAQAVTPFVAFESVLQWQPLGDIGVRSFFRELAFMFDDFRSVARVDYYALADLGETTREVITKAIVNLSNDITYAFQARLMSDRYTARSSVVRPKLTIAAALSPWRLVGMRVQSEPYSTRVAR